jgi:hypothetical protein
MGPVTPAAGSRRELLALLAVEVALFLACSSPIRVESLAAMSERPIHKLAVVPFEPQIPLTAGGPADEAATYVTSRVLESLSDQERFVVIPPGEVLHALGARGQSGLPSAPDEIGGSLAATFGVDALVFGQVRRFNKRTGGAKGASRPASVRFDMELRGEDGALLWRGVYDETQRSISEDLGSFSLAMSRGFRWVTAEELAGYGARELVAAMSEAVRSWR